MLYVGLIMNDQRTKNDLFNCFTFIKDYDANCK